MAIRHQSMCIKVGLSSLRHVPAEYKDKVPDVSDSHRDIEKLCNSKLSSPKFKDLCVASIRKLLTDEAATISVL